MSEGAAEAEAGTADVDTSAAGSETETEDTEAAGLLDAMSGNDPEALSEELEKWRKEARKWEGRSKQNSDAAARLKEIEQQNMSELEKAQAAQRDAEERAATATAMHNRVMSAAANNLPVDLIDYLGSGTEEEINETAEVFARVIEETVQQRVNEILASNASRNGQPMSGARPVESMRPGSAPASGGTPTSPDEWFRQLLSER
jgi:Skp family chaperone for outer membrane proteins